MKVSFNGESFEYVSDRVKNRTLALVCCDYGSHCAYAILGQTGKIVCIEAVEGLGGFHLVRALVRIAHDAGLKCEGWTFDAARVRLFSRLGFRETGERRVSGSGREQRRVVT